MIRDDLTMTGRLKIVLSNADGQIVDVRESKNLVVTTGKAFIASRMAGSSASVMTHMAIGTSSDTPVAGNTTLGSEVARATLTSTTPNNNDVVYVATFPAGSPSSTAAIVEAGLFNAASGGTMLCHAPIGVITKPPTMSLTITWTVTAN